MNLRLKKALAIATMPLAGAGLVAGLMTAAPAYAFDKDNAPASEEGSNAVSAATHTVPWCGWTISGISGSLELKDTSLTGDKTVSKYVGEAINLEGTSGDISAYVSGTKGTPGDECSWYGNKKGLSMSIEPSGYAFSATASTPSGPKTDAGMGFNLTSTHPLAATASYTSCGANFNKSVVQSIYADAEAVTPVSTKNKDSVTTSDACSWNVQYETTIPAGGTPLYGNADYSFAGPTLVTTVSVTD
jgi:hypothetical protein